ncbi:zinc-binding dehydrogenase [Nocardioides sp. Bht2]|uniref:zinc-binding dehydrogenase n=1 Tax=Nocardioides sp. Bht2 TaxID=3392297 RepID=UPI0039B526BE
MHAIRHHAFGPADVLGLELLVDLTPQPGQLRIAVEAAGVHVLDTAIRAGRSFGMGQAPELPAIPGREVAGTVDLIGDGVERSWLGRRVVAHLGLGGGGYASQAVVAVERAYSIPDGLDAATAVAAIGTGRTASAILELSGLTSADTAAVTSAAGGLGALLLQGIRAAGGTAVGVSGGGEKAAIVTSYGATAIDHRAADWADQIDEHGPYTLVFDGVGGVVGEALYRRLAPGGRLVRYGWFSDEPPTYDDPQRRVIDVLGPPILSRIAEFEQDALAAAASGVRVPLVSSHFDLADAAEAHRAIEQRRTVGKVVLAVSR